MSFASEMQVSVRLPARVLFEGPAARLTATAADGAFGMLPNHVDYVTELVPSVLLITQPDGRERIFRGRCRPAGKRRPQGRRHRAPRRGR